MRTNPGQYYAVHRGHERSALVKRGRKIIAEVFTDREAGDQYQTASLYASAPALLDALRWALGQIEDDLGPDHQAALAAAHAAVSRALWGQPVKTISNV